MRVRVDDRILLDAEQLALGTYHPLTGFMNDQDLEHVLENMRLADGQIWPMPVLFPVEKRIADSLLQGSELSLLNKNSNAYIPPSIKES